jgi:hypothetical protein
MDISYILIILNETEIKILNIEEIILSVFPSDQIKIVVFEIRKNSSVYLSNIKFFNLSGDLVNTINKNIIQSKNKEKIKIIIISYIIILSISN